MKSASALLLLAIAFLLLPAPGLAQKGSVELGADLSASYNLIDDIDGFETDDIFQFSLPFGGSTAPLISPQTGFRVGFFVSDAVAIEPVTTFAFLDSGGDNITTWSLAAKLLYHFSPDASRPRFYLGGGGTLSLFSASDSDTETQFGLLGELGVKLPVSDYFGWRLAAGFTRLFESDSLNGQSIIFAAIGFSVFP